jgi:hypothetical protein
MEKDFLAEGSAQDAEALSAASPALVNPLLET